MAIGAVAIDSNSGISIKSFREIRQAIAKAFMEVFGAGINLDPSAPDGMLVDLLAYMYTELAQAIQTVGANIDVSTATGAFLDMLASIAGLTRNEGESDESLRERIEQATFEGLATPNGMLTYLRENITASVSLKENCEDVETEGIPPHHFAIYVPSSFSTDMIDQTDKDWISILEDATRENSVESYIAQKIWNCKPAGIKGTGDSFGIARDAAGFLHKVCFQFIKGIAYKVKVSITQYDEEALPTDYAEKIQQLISDWASSEFTSGKDIIPQRMCVPIYSGITGVDAITVQVAQVYSENWSSSRIPVSDDTTVTIAAEDVSVTLEG